LAPHSTASQEAYQNNLLGAFDSGTADQTLSEFNEEDERQFQSALRATGTGSSPSKQPLAATAPVAAQGTSNPAPAANLILHSTEANQMAPSAVSSGAATHLVEGSLVEASLEATSEEVSIDSDSTILHTKTSISDARSQIKLKIKSPLVYPEHFNAMTNSSSLTLSSTMVQSSSTVQATVSTSTVVSASSAVSGNSRRMRKKELLSLYVVQKDNLNDDSSCGLPAASDNLPLENLLRKSEEEDELSGGNGSKRFKKNSSSRELRALDANLALVEEQLLSGASGTAAGTSSGDGRRRSACSSGSNNDNNGKTGAASSAGKRRGRSKTLESSEEDHQAPKLKIKIRGLAASETPSGVSNAGEGQSYSYEMTRRACPPKKRLTSNYSTLTLEEIKRDSMNYRKKVMQDFDKGEDNNKREVLVQEGESLIMPQPPTKRPKSSKPKKDKKEKKRQKQQQLILSSSTTTMTTTLIENTASASPGDKPKLILRFGKRKAETTTKTVCLEQPPAGEAPAPLRFKIARNSSGGGYIIGTKADKKDEPTPEHTSPGTELPLMAPLGEASPQGRQLNSFTPHSQNANASPALLGKDTGTPSPPCLVIDSSKSADVHDSTSLPESGVAAMGVPASLVGATTPLCVNVGNYENSNNSLPSASGTSASSNSCNSNSNNNNNNNNNGSGGGRAGGGGSLLPLKKDCEVR